MFILNMFSAQTDRNKAELQRRDSISPKFPCLEDTRSGLEGYYEHVHEAEATDASDKHQLGGVLFLAGSTHEAAHTRIESDRKICRFEPKFCHLQGNQKGK